MCKHLDRPIKAKGMCGACYNAHLLDTRPGLREAANARRRAAHKAAGPADPAKKRDRVLKHRYGISSAIYDAMLSRQEGRCALCKAKPEGRRLAVDHCHITGTVRELLCDGCNNKVAVLESDPALLRDCRVYILKHAQLQIPF